MKRRLTSTFFVVAMITMAVAGFTGSGNTHPNPNCNDRDVGAGKTMIVAKGCRVHGDVRVGRPGQAEFTIFPDEDASSGMVVMCRAKCRVHFPFGGGITGQQVESIAKDLVDTGCESGCLRVDLRVFP